MGRFAHTDCRAAGGILAPLSSHVSETPLNVSCRVCGTPLKHLFVDLGMSPLCQTVVRPEQINDMEPFYPLRVYVCGECFLVQLDEYVPPQGIFTEYAYFSSCSPSWIAHAERYVDDVSARFGLGGSSFVVEIASNDGYLLQHFVRRGVDVLGVEPARNVALVAVEKGIPTTCRFFDERVAAEIADRHKPPDLILGNNVLAHVPQVNSFVRGIKMLLKPGGVVTMEFPHLMNLIDLTQFDTIYHEHFSYLSLLTVHRLFASHELEIFDVQRLPVHGGSLRIFAKHAADPAHRVEPSVAELLELERERGFADLGVYEGFGDKVARLKRDILSFLIAAREDGRTIAGYGAPGKGNTLLNYCGIRTDFIDYTVDVNPYKQGTYTPGARIPVYPPERIRETRPDYLFILPWNLRQEIVQQTAYIRDWGGRWVVPIPAVEVLE
ncbi:MAG: class I SAM-dependent methyltransferase [Gammaproteobacteria bacterium]|nr:class I SAM-dependent methyltransferase [Gammaproteobacteria bacterium]